MLEVVKNLKSAARANKYKESDDSMTRLKMIGLIVENTRRTRIS
jgi:hypothetical protein